MVFFILRFIVTIVRCTRASIRAASHAWTCRQILRVRVRTCGMTVNFKWGARVCALDKSSLHFVDTISVGGRVSIFAFCWGTVVIVKGTGTALGTRVTTWTVVDTLNVLCVALVYASFVGTGFVTSQIDHFAIMATHFGRVLISAILAVTWESEENKRKRSHPLTKAELNCHL